MRQICGLLAIALLASCALLSPPQPEPAKEVLSKLPLAIPHGHARGMILVLRPDTSPAYGTTRMAYTERRYQIGYFRDHEWADPPAQMIQKLLILTLERTGAFRAVRRPPEPTRAAYALQSELLELLQDYTESPPVARLALRVALLGPSGQLLADREITLEEPMHAANPYAGVVAANDVLARALQEVAQFVLEHVR